ncbi:Biotin synthase-related enzyme [Geoglobus ahangari]|uniref:Biotin synthase-related enzyme n=1 Tax=Geoglobus ahangari TaxID=113653 RepID=A0A0F7IC63_9EURY|nr:radical SAM protein [Geoglobus ahangari]AKG90814.1 Biotin synthase-related enzyme [Geoglobus ahangari]
MLDLKTKIELLTLGVRAGRSPLRKGGGGPTGGLGFRVSGSVVSAPALQHYVAFSPYHIENVEGEYILFRGDEKVGAVEFPKADYYHKKVGGVPAGKLVALDGYDTLVSAVSRRCVHWETGKKCSFCNIQDNLKNAVVDKDLELLAQAVKLAYEEDRSRHLTLTTGTTNLRDKGALSLASAVRAIKREVDIQIHVQIEPAERKYIEMLYESGADTIGIHVESFDPVLREKVVPGKPGLDEYLKSWKIAVDVFGEWNVSSWLLTGLGESPDSIIRGVKTMLSHAVYPFIAPFRPPPASNLPRPDVNYHVSLANSLKVALEDLGIDVPEFGSGCPKCNGCSLTKELLN